MKKKPAGKKRADCEPANPKSSAKNKSSSKGSVKRKAAATRAARGAGSRHAPTAAEATGDAYSRHKERARERQAKQSAEGRDIAAEMPKVSSLATRRRIAKSLRLFCEDCLAERFTIAWSDDHLKAVEKMESAMLAGDNFAIAMARGSGKTTLVIAAVIWAILCGHKRYVALIGADRDAATKLLDGVKVELETNDRLLELFPEAVYPIRRLEGIPNRCRGQTYQGNRTYIKWTAKHIQFADIPKRGEIKKGERTAASAIIETAGITGKIRGMQQALPSGEIARPDCFVVDDPQTDASADSRKHVTRRLNVITGTCPGLAGPGASISGFVTCTVIQPDDVADQLLNPEKYPDFHGERFKLIYKWPDDSDLWEEYSNKYREAMALKLGYEPLNQFVRENWDPLHAGSKVAWPERMKKNEVSPLQHAYHLLFRLGDMFWCEYQNEPKSADDAEDLLSVDEIQRKISGYPRKIVSPEANLATAYIDVQGNVLFWAVLAFRKQTFDCWLLDYGTWPRQRANYYSKAKLGKKLSDVYSGSGLEGRIKRGILELADHLATTDFKYPDGERSLRISRIGVDAAWGKSSTVVYAACLESRHRSIMLPVFGRGLDASKLPMEFWTAKPGEIIGVGYSTRPRPGGGRYGLLDSNYWKSFLHARLSTASGDRGCYDLFQPESVTTHRMIAEHYRSEQRSESNHNGRTVPVWTLPTQKPDNVIIVPELKRGSDANEANFRQG